MMKKVGKFLLGEAIGEFIWQVLFGAKGLMVGAILVIGGITASVVSNILLIAVIVLGAWALFSLFFMYRAIQYFEKIKKWQSEIEEWTDIPEQIALNKSMKEIK